MENSDHVIALIESVCEENFRKTYYDLCLTENRMIFLYKKSKFDNSGASIGYAVGGLLGGLAGAVIGASIHDSAESKKKMNAKSLTLDELLKSDKKNYAVNYEEVEWFKLNTPKFGYHSIVFRNKGKTKTLYLPEEETKKISNILPSLSALNRKIVK
jgi:hypothetical protein